jgi:AraC-like DNA-binding protein
MSLSSPLGDLHTVPIALVSQLVHVARRWDVPAADLLGAVGLSEERLTDPFERISVKTMFKLLERARARTGEPGLGYYLGLDTRATLYGAIGFAALAAATIGDALALGLQFAPLFSTALAMELSVEGGLAVLTFEERTNLGSVRDIVLINLIVGLREVGTVITGRKTGGSADYAFPEPAYQARFAHVAPPSRFDRPKTRFLFDATVLNYPVLTRDPFARERARIQCAHELDELRARSGLAGRARRLLASEDVGSLDHLAARLNMAPRTVRRRLASEGVSFSTLVDEMVRDEAQRLVRSSRMPIKEVARRLGYTYASSFVRAFYRWTGKTPARYRHGAGTEWASDPARRRRPTANKSRH